LCDLFTLETAPRPLISTPFPYTTLFRSIYAPMDGTVVSIEARQGQTLNANQMAPTLMRIADLSTMTVQAQVSEADISKLRKNMRSEEHTSELQSRENLVCRLLLEKKKTV